MRRTILSSLAVASILVILSTQIALAAPNHRRITILDNCGPSFNVVLGEGACSRAGGMSFDTFFGMLAGGGAPTWRFAPEWASLADGGTLTAVNRGGEFHTFTQVAAFGGGCVPPINAEMGLDPIPECDDPSLFGTTGVAPGASLGVGPLDTGTYLFQCLIHPWQRSTVVVR